MLAAIAEIARVIEQAGWHRSLSARLTELETRQDGLTARLQDMPPGTPDIHPNTAEAYRHRIERLTEVPSHPDDALQATDAIRWVIDFLIVTPGEKRVAAQSPFRASLARSSTGSAAGTNSAPNPSVACRPCGLIGGGTTCFDSRLLTKAVLC